LAGQSVDHAGHTYSMCLINRPLLNGCGHPLMRGNGWPACHQMCNIKWQSRLSECSDPKGSQLRSLVDFWQVQEGGRFEFRVLKRESWRHRKIRETRRVTEM
jgi:hypothetical protein